MPVNPNSGINIQHALDFLSSTRNLFDGTTELINLHESKPNLGSIAFDEWSNFQDKELIIDVYCRAGISLESAADHLISFADLYSEPAKTLAPWTCVRGLLESSAIGTWFLDPSIDARTRVARCFAWRYEGLCQQLKYCRTIKSQSNIDKTNRRISEVEQKAIKLGFSRILKPDGSINGIAMSWPGITELIKTTLNSESAYRLLSEIAHGHQWAIGMIGFREDTTIISNLPNTHTFVKHVHPESILYAGIIAIPAFSKLLWNMWLIYGWGRSEIEDFLNKIYDQAHLANKMRFWRSK